MKSRLVFIAMLSLLFGAGCATQNQDRGVASFNVKGTGDVDSSTVTPAFRKNSQLSCVLRLDGSAGPKQQEFSKKIDAAMIRNLTRFELSYMVNTDRLTVVNLDVGIDESGFYIANLTHPYDRKNQGYFTASSEIRSGSGARYISVSSNWEQDGQNPVLRASAECEIQ